MNWNLKENFETRHGVIKWDSYGNGSPCVLLHGTPFCSYIWRELIPVLSQRHQVYIWDMLGFGESDKNSENLDLKNQTSIFLDLLDFWKLEAPRVIAHDVGAVLALRAMLVHGVQFKHLSMLDAASITGWGNGSFFKSINLHESAFQSLPDWATDSLIEAKIRSGSYLGLREEALNYYLQTWCTTLGRQCFYRQYRQGGEQHTADIQPLLSEITIPVHVIWGEEDQWLDLKYAQRLINVLPGHTRFSHIAAAGHMVQEDQPGALISLLLQ